MWHHLKDFWTYNRAAFLAFVVVFALAGVFGARAVTHYIYWSDPGKQNQRLAGWMTPRYVAKSYDVPPEVIKTAWNLNPDSALRRASLDTIAQELGLTLEEMQQRVAAAALAFHAAQPDE